ncbi:hypothetical protein BD324DRAFT_635574 [Kockovaella imperatae]|uniref:mitogen-activated protein kinase kinase kinase n=1 Tax=Kockovaella imperatae TaxID=4999 RepID=A0A1Y1U8L1_9TREE|nr:hypothetical protein BD324DRAFT_635574 [Kockovaella imperatae]ORX34363.1 hypothetical protein BD324DRAFT_635574 [Kockovaella imperatae]
MTATLRPHGSQAQHSPTSPASSVTTTPTSPHFMTTQATGIPRYASHPFAAASTASSEHTRTPSRPPSPPLFRPPPNQLFSTYLKSWGPQEMTSFLSLYKCAHYAPVFQRNDIDGKVLLDLDMASLKEMGISKVGERVKLLGGIKELRKRAAATGPISLSRIELRLNGAATPPLDDSTSPLALKAPEKSGRRLHTGRPPPLDLQPHAGSRPLPQAYQNPPSATRSTTPRPRPGPPSHASSSSTTIRPVHSETPSNQASQAASSSSVPAPSRPNLRAPPPRFNANRRSPSPNAEVANFAGRPLPPAPGQSSAAEYANAITQQRETSDGRATPSWAQTDAQYGLPKGPAPRAPPAKPDHRKQASMGTPSKTSPMKTKFSAIIGRPNTNSGPVHPFAANRAARDEEHPRRASPPSDGLNYKRAAPGYVVGSGGMTNTKGTMGDRTKMTSSMQAQLPLEDIRRQVVKFINKEDNTSRTVNVASCSSGVEVLERVLKKFGKWNTGTSVSTDGESDEDGDRLEVDGWGVYAESDPDDDAKPLSEASLLGICLSHRDGSVMREKGLVLRRTRQQKYRKNMEEFFGDTPPPATSPTSPTYYGPRLGAAENDEMLSPSRNALKKTNRASTVSVMSGLGVAMLDDVPPSPSSLRVPPSGSFLASKSRRMYNFFGHRPPSELIANHLGEYFPAAKRRELEKSRHSMLRLSGPPRRSSVMSSEHRDSRRDTISSTPRRSQTSHRTNLSSPPAASIPEEGEEDSLPRVSISNETGENVRFDSDLDSTHSTDSKPPLLPPFVPSKESLSDQLGAYSPLPQTNRAKSIHHVRRGSGGSTKSRMSTLSQLRRNRDRSDTASMLTVDEITAEVENRRASTITFDESDEDIPAPPPVIDPGVIPSSEAEDDSTADEESEEESFSEDDEDEDEEDDDDDDEADQHGKAFTSTGSKRIIKWIKGALIGAGSFGSVFLGMDAHSGLLMAVKQVELPTGSARNEERKRSMVDALEREIELLKELQHENIVQYLDSSADANHLNIFLEYVPGGSVAALLNNYGAFEEALVRNFVRQILEGLNYLHQREIIHRDIKGANILVDNKGGIKISDFGISKKVENNLLTGIRTHRPSLQGSVFWMAPEIVKQTSYTSKADIWSVGCLVVEMLTGTHPWAELTQMQAIFRIGSSARPAMPNDISSEASDFLNKSFEVDHAARPTAAHLLEHAFIAPKIGTGAGTISAAQARSAMAAANKTREAMMGGMQSLSAFAEVR